MDVSIEQSEMFPHLASSTTSRRPFREWFATFLEHGPLMTPKLAAAAMALSRQRVHTLINEGRIATVMVDGERFIPAAAVELFMSEERGSGVRVRPSVREKFTAAMRDRAAK
jgi:hypothetical protein